MGDRHGRATARWRRVWLFAVVALGAIAGCSGGPSPKELSHLEEQREAMAAAEQKVAQQKAEKARLGRRRADKEAEQGAADQRKAETEANLASPPKR